MVDVSVDRGIHMRTFLPQNKIKIPLLKLLSFSLFPNTVEFYLRRDTCMSNFDLKQIQIPLRVQQKMIKKLSIFFTKKVVSQCDI